MTEIFVILLVHTFKYSLHAWFGLDSENSIHLYPQATVTLGLTCAADLWERVLVPDKTDILCAGKMCSFDKDMIKFGHELIIWRHGSIIMDKEPCI